MFRGMPGVLYLHGFCSSSGSAKGTFLAARFAQAGVETLLPDLDGGDFRGTTLTRQLALVGRLAESARPTLLVGSSLGGYLAALFAARNPGAVPGIALLAPAFDFAGRLRASVGDGMDSWCARGFRNFHHYGAGSDLSLAYGFVRDAERYEPLPDVRIPSLVLHGLRDDVVPPALSADFARGNPHVEVEWLDSDHQLLDSTGALWSSLKSFFDRMESGRS